MATYGSLLSLFILGSAVAQTNALRMNDWMEGSIAYLEAIIDPVIFSADSPEEMVQISLSAEEKAEFQEKLSELRIYDEDLPGDVLVSFEKLGLALIEGKTITPLSSPEKRLSTILPDGSIILYDDPGCQVLTRAVIRDNALYEMWERRIPPTMYLHHWGDEFKGELYHAMKTSIGLPDAMSMPRRGSDADCPLENVLHHTIGVFDASTGELKRHIAILPQIAALGEEGDDIRTHMKACREPLHLNTVHVVKDEKQAHFFPNGKVGDLLISLRRVDTIALLDRDTSEVKWHVTGPFKRQHDPIITDRGTIILFDNLGGDAPNGTSRIVEIDIGSREVVGIYEATGDDYFESYYRGKVKMLDDRRILIQEDFSNNSNNHDVTMFTLDCPGPYISNACRKSLVFRGRPDLFRYTNAELLESDPM
jgi:hypothetical protein